MRPYVVTARTDVAKAYCDTCVVRVIYVTELQHKIGNSANWHRFNGPRKILYGKNSQIKAELIPDINGAGDNLHWDGSYGASGVGKVIGHYLLSPSQYDNLMNFLRKPAKWGYFYTCADWARDAYLAATGEKISASDYVFGTPRAVSGSIIEKEQNAATSIDSPYDGGEEPPPTSDPSSSGGWTGDSFPSSL